MIENYLKDIQKSLNTINGFVLEEFVDLLYITYRNNNIIFTMGNGGSAATASHFVNDLIKLTTLVDRKRIKAVSLVDNIPLITAYANDLSYPVIFSEQLKSLLTENDLIVAISTSGNSPNILNAVKYANELGAITVGLTGGNSGVLDNLAKFVIKIPNTNTCQVEDLHLIICHIVSLRLKEKING